MNSPTINSLTEVCRTDTKVKRLIQYLHRKGTFHENIISKQTVLYKSIVDKKPMHDSDFVMSLQPQIKKLRKQFYNYAISMPKPLNSVLVNHFRERLKEAKEEPMIGEYASFIIGDLLSITPLAQNRLAFPWLLLYVYSLQLDDLLDKKRAQWQYELLLSQILLDSSLMKYREIIGNEQHLWNMLEIYRRQSVEGMIYEMEWSEKKNRSVEKSTIIQQGRKAALVKYCASGMLYLDKKRTLTLKEEEGVDCLCSGIQLLDDLADVVEDHKAGRFNILLQETYSWIRENICNIGTELDMDSIGKNQLLVSLIFSGSVTRLWIEAAKQLSKATDLLSDNDMNRAKIYIDRISDKCLESSALVENIMEDNKEIVKDIINVLANGEQETKHKIKSSKISEVWTRIAACILEGPKAHN